MPVGWPPLARAVVAAVMTGCAAATAATVACIAVAAILALALALDLAARVGSTAWRHRLALALIGWHVMAHDTDIARRVYYDVVREVLLPILSARAPSRKLILLLLYIGCVERHPGPPHAADDGQRALKVGTLNTPGLHMMRRNRMGAVGEEGWGDGFQLLTTPGKALKAVRELFAQGGLSVGVLTETRTQEEELAAVEGYMSRAQYGYYGTPGVKADGSTHTTGGVSIIWDARRLRALKREVLMAGRVLRVELEILGSAERLVILGAYMPNRQCAADAVEPAWDTLILAATSAGARTVVAGDLNAELRRQVEARGAGMKRADALLGEMIAAAALQATGTGEATHKKGGEIDHVLVHQALAGSTSGARVLPGVTANDHKCVYVEIAHQVDVAGSGPPRQVGPRLGGVAHTDARWARYRTAVERAEQWPPRNQQAPVAW